MDTATLDVIDAHVAGLPIDEWAPLSTSERELVRKALAPQKPADEVGEDSAALSPGGRKVTPQRVETPRGRTIREKVLS